MKCGCEIDCNNKPKTDNDRKVVSLMAPADFQFAKLNKTLDTDGLPQIFIQAIEGFDGWEEVGSRDMDQRDKMLSAHEFIVDTKRTTMEQRRRASLVFGVTGGRVPRCWLD